jgi:type IV pilus assembly protein PilQ
VDFPDEEIRNILRNVADLFELNLVVPDTLQGRTSIKLRDVTWRQIFQVSLSPVGYTYLEDGNIIKVVSQESLAQEPTTTDVYIINYAKAQDILASIQPLVDPSAGGRIVVDSRSNALVITERPSQLSRIKPIIEKLDTATEQVMIESKFIEVTNRDIQNIGVNWASLANYQVGVGGINQTFERTRTQTRDDTGDNANTRNATNSTDATNTTSSTRGTTSGTSSAVTSTNGVLTSNSSTTSGTTLDNSSGANTTGTNASTISDIANSLTSLVNGAGTARTATAVFSASDFNLVLSALKQQNDTKLVSNPTIVTLNNTEAQIKVGEEFPIPNYTYNAERGTFEVSGFEYRPIGILLKVTPQVNAQGFIRLTVEPEVSSQSGTTSFGGAGGAEIPIIATRKATTQVSLRDGFTMGIGGLIENNQANGQTRVPVLGSIPLLGRLFRSDNKSAAVRNLLIFITARTVSAEGAPIEEVFDSRNVRATGMKRDELPGYRDGSDPFAPVVPEQKKR